jgi:hypothetical protein
LELLLDAVPPVLVRANPVGFCGRLGEERRDAVQELNEVQAVVDALDR